MRITKTEEYGIRLVLRLAAEGGQMTAAELARKEALSEPTVGKLLNRLKGGRLVDSVRGRSGGYELTRPADSVTVSDVLEALGQAALSGSACTDGEDEAQRCPHLRRCNLRPVWSHLETLLSQVFDRTSVADLLEQERQVRTHLHEVVTRVAGEANPTTWPALGGGDENENGRNDTIGVSERSV